MQLVWSAGFSRELKRILRCNPQLRNVVEQTLQTLAENFEGTGKPEALRHGLSGYWSRRINNEHRPVYKVEKDAIFPAQLRCHY